MPSNSRHLLIVFFFIGLLSCGTQQISNYSSNTSEINKDNNANDLDSIIDPYKFEMEETMSIIIGQASQTLEKYTPESPLGNFSADVMYTAGLNYAKKQSDLDSNLIKNAFCLLNFGGLRSSVNQGDISVGNVFELMPFDNTLTLVQIPAIEVNALLIYLKKVDGQPISGAKIDLKSNQMSLEINGQEYDKESDVLIITSDYLAGGGDKMDFFKSGKKVWNSGILMRDIYIDFIKKNKNIGSYPVEGRILLEEK